MVKDFCVVRGGSTLDLALIRRQGLTKLFVKLQRNDRLGQLVQIAAQDVGGIVDSIPGPVQAFSIPFGGVEDLLEILDAFCRSVKTKDTFHIGRYSKGASVSRVPSSLNEGGKEKGAHPFLSRRPHIWQPRWGRNRR